MFSNCYICNNFLMISKYSPCDFLSPPEQMILSVLVFIIFFQGSGSTQPRNGSNTKECAESLELANTVTKLCATLSVWSGQNSTRKTARSTAGHSGTGSPPASPAPPSTSPPCCPASSSTTTTRDHNISTQAVSTKVWPQQYKLW